MRALRYWRGEAVGPLEAYAWLLFSMFAPWIPLIVLVRSCH